MNKNLNNETEISVLNISLKIPEKLTPVIESLCRITDRELDDLCTLLIIDQLNFFHKSEGEILRYMKDSDTFRKNLSEGITQYYNNIENEV
ncbi:MAG: hypothetical protein ACFFCV_18760 [Promethearchaeota archaeon]